MIEFANVLLIKRILRFNDNQISCSIRREGIRGNSRTQRPLCFYNRNSGGRNVDTNLVDINASQQLQEEQTPISQGRCYSITDTIDFAAFFVFMLSYIIFNCIYLAHYM